MRALGWRAGEDAAGERVRQRLAALRAEAEQASGRKLSWEKVATHHQPPKTWGDSLFTAAAIVVLCLLLLGGIAFIVQGVQVLGWFGN